MAPPPSSPDASSPARDGVEIPGRLSLFGHDPVEARVTLRPRSRGWRMRRTLLFGGGILALAPLVALLPPHAPWAVAAVGGGVFVGRRQWLHRYTVLGMSGSCPRCGAAFSLSPGTRLRRPHAISCDDCNHESSLAIDDEDLPRRG
jgi:hypothetical protein